MLKPNKQPPVKRAKDRRKAVFFDRDGVINIDHGYVSTKHNFIFVDGIFPLMRTLMNKGYVLIVVTNQSGIGRSYYTEQDFQGLTDWMLQQFAAEKIDIAAVYHCPHTSDRGCDCRKPAPGMLLQAIREQKLNPAFSWMIGNKESDMLAAEAAGIPHRVLIGDGYSEHSTRFAPSLDTLLKRMDDPTGDF